MKNIKFKVENQQIKEFASAILPFINEYVTANEQDYKIFIENEYSQNNIKKRRKI